MNEPTMPTTRPVDAPWRSYRLSLDVRPSHSILADECTAGQTYRDLEKVLGIDPSDLLTMLFNKLITRREYLSGSLSHCVMIGKLWRTEQGLVSPRLHQLVTDRISNTEKHYREQLTATDSVNPFDAARDVAGDDDELRDAIDELEG